MSAWESLSGDPLEGDRLVRLVYMDEAGTGNPEHEPFLVVAALIVDADKQLVALERHIERLIVRWIPEHQREGFVFHAKELFNGNRAGSGKPFERDHPDWALGKRLQIAEDLAQVPQKIGLKWEYASVERATFPHDETAATILQDWAGPPERARQQAALVTTFAACTMHVDQFMRRQTNEICLLIVEDNEQARRLIRDTQRAFKNPNLTDFLDEEERKILPLRKVKQDPLFEPKSAKSPLQIADFIAYVTKKMRMKDERYRPLFRALAPSLVRLSGILSSKDGADA